MAFFIISHILGDRRIHTDFSHRTTDMFAYSLYLVLRLTIVQQPVCTSKQPPSLRNLLVWNTITVNKPHGINRVANINVKYANAPTLQLNFALIKI